MPIDVSDYVLRWPRHLFRARATELVNSVDSDNEWHKHVSTFLRDAFTTSTAVDEFIKLSQRTRNIFYTAPPAAVRPEQRFLASLLRAADEFEYEARRAPYYSQRASGGSRGATTDEALAAECHRTIVDFDERGYFTNFFGKDCVDDPSDIRPEDVVASRVGRLGLWPTTTARLATSEEDLYDLLEVMHDLAAAPRQSWEHTYGRCGWHYEQFSISMGQAVYRWTINGILERAHKPLRLANDGEDRGRLVQTSNDDRTTLTDEMVARTDPTTADRVRHAIALFRAREADEHSKRSACVVLAGVLEERRKLLQKHVFNKDEGALFVIANKFAIRHQGATQQGDYDPIFLDWIYWSFLSTIDLTDRLIERQAATP